LIINCYAQAQALVVSNYNPIMNNLLIKPFLFVLLLLTISGVMADTELPEEVIFIPKFSSVLGMKVQTKLETKMFKPVGAGLNPLRQVGLDVVYLKSELFISK
jgi:hypothetical protein